MDVFRPDVKAGVFIFIALILLLIGIFNAGGLMQSFSSGNSYTLRFENAQQVQEGTEIHLRGLKVGRIKKIAFAPDNQSVHMIFSIEKEIALLQGTLAKVVDKSVLGGKVIELVPPTAQNALPLPPGSEIEGLPGSGFTDKIEEMASLLGQYKGQIDLLLKKMTDTMDNLNLAIVEAKGGLEKFGNIEPKLSGSIDEFMTTFKDLTGNVNRLIANGEEVLTGIKPLAPTMQKEFTDLSSQMKTQLATVSKKVELLLDDGNRLVNNTDKLILTNQEDLRETLVVMKQMVINFERFSERIANRPSALIWSGKKELKREKGSKSEKK